MEEIAPQIYVGIGRDFQQDVPFDIRMSAADESIKSMSSLAASARALNSAFNELRTAYKKDLQATIGPQKIEGYSRLHARTKERLSEIPGLFPQTMEGDRMKKELKERSISEARQYIAASGIDAEHMKTLQREYRYKAQQAINKVLQLDEGPQTPTFHQKVTELPKPVSNPWTWYSPPYSDAWNYWSWERTRGSSGVDSRANRSNGQIECWSSLDLSGADDSDYTWTNGFAEVRFWFRMPAAGMVEAWGYFQDIQAEFSGCLSDEWGFSDASIQQLSRPYLRVLYPSQSWRYGVFLDYRRGESEGCWSDRINGANPGDFRYPHLFSMESFPAGQWVYVAIGNHDYNYFWVNDMSCHTRMTSRWFVKNAAVRSTGAP
ncbi:MAG: hypothetical protein GKC10_02385 [Methanosarcinales archaeon]|nr:hypothetical protein [Methanosarcinales archaeon]